MRTSDSYGAGQCENSYGFARAARAVAAVAMVVAGVLTLGPPVATAAPELAGAAVSAPEGPAQAWLVADMDSGKILGAKDPYGQYAPASTIKVLLAMVVLDHLNPNAAVRAGDVHTQVECSCAGVVPGQVYTARQLLDGLLMVSGNDAANLLATMLGGYRPTIAAMTAKAQALGARNTRAMSPSGLDGPGWETVTTPHDLAILFRASLGYPVIAQIFQQRTASFPSRDGAKELVAQNKMLDSYPGDLAGKTGFTNLAGETFEGAAQRDGRRILVVLMKSDGDVYGQAAALLDWGFAQPR